MSAQLSGPAQLASQPAIERREAFLLAYTANLLWAIKRDSGQYAYSEAEAPTVAVKMVAAMARGGANLNSPAIKATCKQLNVKLTISAIRDYLTAEPTT